MFDPKDPASYRDAIERFRRARPDYEALARHIQEKLKAIADRLGMYPIIMGRAKSVESFGEKIQRPGKDYRTDPLLEATDLCGVRVITHFLDEVDAFAAEVRKEFYIDVPNSGDTRDRLALNAFGYVSNHLIIQLKEKPRIAGVDDETLERLPSLKCELQLRTLGQHIWADIYHELGYKNEFQLPARWQREFARLAALLEDCDKGFQRVKDAMSTYECSYGAYMTTRQLQDLARRLEILLTVEPRNVKAVHRLIRAYLALEGSDEKIKQVLESYSDLVTGYAPALRDFGVAYTQAYPPGSEEFARGRKLLEAAVEADPRDVDAYCSLGGTHRRAGDHKAALKCYRSAHRLDRTSPYALGNYIAEELLRGRDKRVLPVFHGLIEGALERCASQLEVKINFPWVFFDLGLLHLYLGNAGESAWDFDQSVNYYAKGIDTAARAWMVRSAQKTIRGFLDEGIAMNGLGRIDKLLNLGYWIKSSGAGPWSPERGAVEFRPPVAILAGGCARITEAQAGQLEMLREALAGFEGTLVSGGTRSGIAAIPGDVQERAGGRLATLGYVPAPQTPGLRELIDERYSLPPRHTARAGFSIFEALAFWEDFLAGSGDPGKVKLLGFNGGPIAASEYRIALAFGARAGIVRGSGEEADLLLMDPLWRDHPGLRALDPSAEAIAAFLRAE